MNDLYQNFMTQMVHLKFVNVVCIDKKMKGEENLFLHHSRFAPSRLSNELVLNHSRLAPSIFAPTTIPAAFRRARSIVGLEVIIRPIGPIISTQPNIPLFWLHFSISM